MSKKKTHSWNPDLRKTNTRKTDITDLVDRIVDGDRLALSQALTLIEDQRSISSKNKSKLLERIFPIKRPYQVIGITGAPGVGKSTVIEHLGLDLIKRGFKVAVLSIDPTSRSTGGSILGDKTRMQALSNRESAYIRPSPSGEVLGGVARSTYLSTLLCAAAGYEIILIETVGVGQSEIEVSQMCDLFVLLLEPGAGDDLQGIKRGIMELADIILITKSDTKPSIAKQTKRNYRHALHLMRNKAHGQNSEILLHDSFNSDLVKSSADQMLNYLSVLNQSGHIQLLRQNQTRYQMDQWVQHLLLERLRNNTNQSTDTASIYDQLLQGKIDPFTAAYLSTRNV